MRRAYVEFLVVPIVLALVLALSCGKDGPTKPSPETPETDQDVVKQTTLQPDSARIVSFEKGLQVEFPNGSVQTVTGITITQEDPMASPDAYYEYFSVGPQYRMDPSGLTFERPVAIRIAITDLMLPSGLGADEVTFTTQEGDSMVVLPTEVDGDSITSTITHFSPLVVTPKTKTDTFANSPPLNVWYEDGWLRFEGPQGYYSRFWIPATFNYWMATSDWGVRYRIELRRASFVGQTPFDEVVHIKELRRIVWRDWYTDGVAFTWSGSANPSDGLDKGAFSKTSGNNTAAQNFYGREVVYTTSQMNPTRWTYVQSPIQAMTTGSLVDQFMLAPFSSDQVSQFAPASILEGYSSTDKFYVKIEEYYVGGYSWETSQGTFTSQIFTKGEIPTEYFPPPTVRILSPTNGSQFISGQPVQLGAEVESAPGTSWNPADVVWESDLDGQLGTGIDLITSSLRGGTHLISCTATDSKGKTGGSGITIKVLGGPTNEDPTLTIEKPTGTLGGEVTLTYSVADREGDASSFVVRYRGMENIWKFATVVRTSAGSIASYGVGGKKLAGIAPGTHTFVWDSATDLPHQRSIAAIQMTYLRGVNKEAWTKESGYFYVTNPNCVPLVENNSFGSVVVNSTKVIPIQLLNAGPGVLTGTVSIDCTEFTLVDGGGPFTLAVDERRMIHLRFAPVSLGNKSCRVEFGTPCGGWDFTGVGIPQEPIVVTVNPPTADVQVGWTQSFNATVTGTTNTARIWRVDGGSLNGTISPTGLYTAPATVPSPPTVTVRATSVADTSKSGTATVTVTAAPVIVVTVEPGSASVQTGHTQQFNATVTGTTNKAVTWKVDQGASGGTISSTGLYTAPGTVPSPATVTVRATSVADNSKSGTATVTLIGNTPPTASFTVTPTSSWQSTTFMVDASGCLDAEDPASALEVRWDWENDGTWDTEATTTKTASSQYSRVGEKTIALEVRDTGSSSNTTTRNVTVGPPFLVRWGHCCPGEPQESYAAPEGIAVGPNGDLYVIDYYHERVTCNTNTGAFVRAWGIEGADPLAIAADDDGYVYVAIISHGYGWNGIMKFTTAGEFVGRWNQTGPDDSLGAVSRGVAADDSGYVYVADSMNKRIVKFTSNGGFVTAWGWEGTIGGQLDGPDCVAVDHSDHVYVFGKGFVEKFTDSGVFITKWQAVENPNVYLAQACMGIAVDNNEDVYVTDYAADRIHKFTSSGTFLGGWDSKSSGFADNTVPFGIAVDGDGNVYVVDRSSATVNKFGPFTPGMTLARGAYK